MKKDVYRGIVILAEQGRIVPYLGSDNQVRLIATEQATEYHLQQALSPEECRQILLSNSGKDLPQLPH